VTGAATARAPRREGFVLLAVVFFYVLLVSFVATFLRRAVLDTHVVRNRDAAETAEALARGGIELATALLLEDRLLEQEAEFRVETLGDVWAEAGNVEIPGEDGALLRLRVEDAGARLNLNALFDEEGALEQTEVFLGAFLDKVIGEMPGRREDKPYDTAELARNLIDYVDTDDVAQRGDREDEFYQAQKPPYRAANRPVLSVGELRLVQGFDAALVEALEPYVTVYPYTSKEPLGINPNTAPSWVLATLYHGTGGEGRLADEDLVRKILLEREKGAVFCSQEADAEECTSVEELMGQETIFPPPAFVSDVFRVRAEATVGDLRRTVEAVIDRSEPSEPQRLAWRVF
jgi:general secretion pathway protein K